MTDPATDASSAPAIKPVGLLAVGVAAPAYRLPIAEARAAWGEGGGKGQVAVCGSDEDALTLAWEAADSALESPRAGGLGEPQIPGTPRRTWTGSGGEPRDLRSPRARATRFSPRPSVSTRP